MNFGFSYSDAKNPIEAAKKEFFSSFGNEFEWFFNILNLVRNVKRDYGVSITDVLIKREMYPLFGILKNFFDPQVVFDVRLEKITGIQIRSFVEKYFDVARGYRARTLGDEFFQKRKTKSFDFALAFYGLGVFRVNFSMDNEGEVLNIRCLDFVIPELEKLIFDWDVEEIGFLTGEKSDKKRAFQVGAHRKMLYEFITKGFFEERILNLEKARVPVNVVKEGGLVLHAGPTGSGKTTFIASELLYLAENIAGLIVTYEKPIEYRFLKMPKVLQYELGVHIDEDEVYRHFLRNSPAVGFYHEIRDRSEFLQVLDLASRGHLIFTTMHASTVIDVFSSFACFEDEVKQLFCNVLRGIICHKLLTTKTGKIVPAYEYFLVQKGMAKADVVYSIFLKNEMVKLKTFLYEERGYPGFVPFEVFEREVKEDKVE